jgi:hypothetical protein
MSRRIYICRRFRSVGPFEFEADFAEASLPIFWHSLVHEDMKWEPTPFQVANARHSPREAERLIAGWVK